MDNNIKKFRRAANVGLYGSIVVVLITVIFHFSPFRVAPQTPEVQRWMLIAGTVLAVLAVVMALMTIRKTTPRIRQLDVMDKKIEAYASYINGLYTSTLTIVVIECVLITLMSESALLMVTILLVLLLFLAYPNMYKMKSDLGLNDEEMKSLFGDAYIGDPVRPDAEPGLDIADAKLEEVENQDEEVIETHDEDTK